jgi:hypothetical protein
MYKTSKHIECGVSYPTTKATLYDTFLAGFIISFAAGIMLTPISALFLLLFFRGKNARQGVYGGSAIVFFMYSIASLAYAGVLKTNCHSGVECELGFTLLIALATVLFFVGSLFLAVLQKRPS